jgi:hypothetical protein
MSTPPEEWNDDFLTYEQLCKVVHWYKVHLLHVFEMIKDLRKGYPPTLEEDKNNPALWKPEHWAWFCEKYIDFDLNE